MKFSKRSLIFGVFALFFVSLFTGSDADARAGSGRSSFGSRGSRGFSQRSYSQPQRPRDTSGSTDYQQQRQQPVGNPNPMGGGGGGFLRSMAGGLAGGLLGSMLFRSLGFAGMPGMGGSGGGMGLFEIMLVFGLCWFGYRWYMARKLSPQSATNQANRTLEPGAVISPEFRSRHIDSGESNEMNASNIDLNAASVIRKQEPTFNVERFQEERMDDFFRIQSAWMNRDLAKVGNILTPEFTTELQKDVDLLKTQGKINRLENIAVREILLIEAWQEFNTVFATVRIRANVIDYSIDEKSGNLIDGNKDESVKFEEDWTFCREYNGNETLWKLTAIQA